MDNPSDESLKEALLLAGFDPLFVLPHLLDEAKSRPELYSSELAHARTIDQRNKLVEALEPFANLADELDTGPYNWGDDQFVVNGIKAGDVRKARQVLTQFRSGQ